MTTAVLANFISLFAFVFNALLLVRVIWSWIDPQPRGGIGGLVFDLTEPVLLPIRRVLPSSYGLDFSPLVAFLLLELLSRWAASMLVG